MLWTHAADAHSAGEQAGRPGRAAATKCQQMKILFFKNQIKFKSVNVIQIYEIFGRIG